MHGRIHGQLHARTEQMRLELERMRWEAQQLEAEARLDADQQLNKLEDQIEELERNADSTPFGGVVALGLGEAWDNINYAFLQAGQIIKRDLAVGD